MKDGRPAFPSGPQMTMNAEGTWPMMTSPQSGMSLRQWYAGMALPSVLNAAIGQEREKHQPQVLARVCFEMADAMIAEGEK